MITGDKLLRYALWGGVLLTANANRKQTPLVTAWLPHLIGNTLSLFLPEIYAAVTACPPLSRQLSRQGNSWPAMVDEIAREVVVDNQRYVEYVAPIAMAYILAHPEFNIYKSDWANRQLFGLGLDSIPHAATAFSLAQMTFDTLTASRRHVAADAPGAALVEQLAEHPDAVSIGVIAAATAVYEGGEYLIHASELKAVNNDPAKVAMEWSVADTFQDIFANFVGLALALFRNRRAGQAGEATLSRRREARA